MNGPLYPLLTRDPASGEPFIVTRLECPDSGVVVEGNFSLGWIGLLTPEQVDFVGVLLRNRNNLQKLANDLGVAYNTARARLDEVVTAVSGGTAQADANDEFVADVIGKLASGEASFEDAISTLKES